MKENHIEYANLNELRGEVRYNAPLNHLTWFKVGGVADILFKPHDVFDLAVCLKQNHLSEYPLDVTVLGAGSNVIIRDKGVSGIVVKLGRNFTSIALENDELVVGAGCLNFNLATFCKNNEIAGFEFLVGIPGTAGGGVFMNAGSYGCEFKDIVTKIEAVDYSGNIVHINASEIKFTYRSSILPCSAIITKVFFKAQKGNKNQIAARMTEISKERSASQPVTERTGGSTFANPPAAKAWQLIDATGMRGKRVGGAEMSQMHCNFMINHGDATAADLENLGELVRRAVLEHSGIELQWEIKRIGRT